MKKTILLSVISAAIFSMGTASAGGGSLFGGDEESSMMNRIYAGGSIGQATARCMLTEGENNDECTTDGWKAFAGYKFTDNIAVEGGYYNLGKAEESYADSDFGKIDASGEATGWGLTGVYSHELMDNFEVFGKAGMMMWNLEGKATSSYGSVVEKQDGTSLLLGAGASYKFTDNLAVRGEYEHYTAEYQDDMSDSKSTSESDVGILSAGMTFSTY
ncbi:MAG: outer membrane beta-barrel protein [Thiolinea sp.]